ncbi:MAG: DUF721 domain-containing protein [Candidatus Omnitrophica bacterium]|nr:DUF721 domain-containing protein [Candidatus Omnitrophota bacterium]
MMRKKDPGHVKGIIEGLITKWEKGAVKRANAVSRAWAGSVEEETKEHARPVSFKNGILMVIVEDSTWLYKLTLEKRKILKRFNENYTGRKKAKDIRFRVGTLDT